MIKDCNYIFLKYETRTFVVFAVRIIGLVLTEMVGLCLCCTSLVCNND